MSKRGMDSQGGEERYGAYGDDQGGGMMDGDKPRQATAAQLARRKIIAPKGRTGSGRNSRQPSPAVAGFSQQPQTFQPPPPSANGFNFSFGSNNSPAPSFGTTPPPPNGTPSFSFGATQPNSSQNSASMFGNNSNNSGNGAPSFGGGSGFGASSADTQNNGFGTSSASIFGQTNPQQTPAASFTFGQNTPQQPAANGFGASASNSFGGFAPQHNTSNTTSSFSFGSAKPAEPQPASTSFSFGGAPKPEEPKPTNGGFSFGASQSQPSVPKENTPSFSFGPSAAQKSTPEPSAPGFSFGAKAATNEPDTTPAPSFSFGAKAATNEPATTPAPSFSFGAKAATSEPATTAAPSFSFGSTSTTNTASATPSIFSAPKSDATASVTPFAGFGQEQKKSESIFSNPVATQADGAKGGLFANQQSTVDQTPKQNTPVFSFGTKETPKPVTAFSGFTQSVGDKPATEQTPKALSLFQPSNQSSTTKSLFSPQQSQGATEQTPKASHPFSGFGQSNTISTASASSAAQPEKSSASLFSQPNLHKSTTVAPPSASPAKSLFEPQASAPAATPQPSQWAQSALPPSSTRPAQSKNLFAATPRVEQHSQDKSTDSDATPVPPKSSAASATKVNLSPPSQNVEKMISLNSGVLAHLQTQALDKDWTTIFVYYAEQAAKLMGKPAFPTPLSSYVPAPAPSTNSAPKSVNFAETPKAASAGASFGAQTPAQNLFGAKYSEPPATAPVPRKRSLDVSEDTEAPATEKRIRAGESVSYPKLPDGASKTAKLFASTLSTAGAQSNGPDNLKLGPPDDVVAKVRQEAAKKADNTTPKTNGFNPSTSLFASQSAPITQSASPSPAFAGFKPNAPATASTTAGFKPTTGSSAGGAVNAFAAFSAQAKANEDKERQKRKDEDYDSDDGNEAEWEARDKAAQEEKRRKIEEAAKSAPVFTFKPTASSAPTPSTNLFAVKPVDADKASGEKAQGSGDHTWNPETPIKFGSQKDVSTTPATAPPPKFAGGLFGSAGSTFTPAPSKLASSSLGFSFGAPKGTANDLSRATTPGVTTDGEASTATDNAAADADGEPSDEPRDKQLGDMTALLDEEKAENEVLFETEMAKATKMDDKRTENGTESGWVEKGRGPLYILKNKATGKARILLKVPPLGREAMNFVPLPGAVYRLAPGRSKIMQGTFVDHLTKEKDKTGKPSLWTVQVRDPADAAEIVRVLNENQ